MAVYIEYHLARYAQNLPDTSDPKESDRLITHALGVLNEQGLYALFLYLRTEEKKKKSKKAAQAVGEQILKMLADKDIHGEAVWSKPFRKGESDTLPFGAPTLFTALQTLCKSRDDLFYAHGLLEQLLTYGRYHAKALAKPDQPTPEPQTNPVPPPQAQHETPTDNRNQAAEVNVLAPELQAAPEISPDQPPPLPEATAQEPKRDLPRVLGRPDLSKQGSGFKKR